MIDLLSLGLTHALMLLAAWRLFGRDDLDSDALDGKGAGGARRGAWGQRRDA
jgi:hypothetical protein